MNLWILNTNFTQVGVVDDYKSLIWTKRYTELGDCELYVAANKKSIQMLQRGYYIVRDDDEMVCRIEAVELDTDSEQGDFLIVTGYDARKILNQRVNAEVKTYSNISVERYIELLLINNVTEPVMDKRKIRNFTYATHGFTEIRMNIQSTYGYLFDIIKELCTTYNYGSRVTWNGEFLKFELYKGVDRSIDQTENDCVVFSPDFDNLISSKYKSDISNYKTATFVVGEGEGINQKKFFAWSDTAGLKRHELFVDASDISSEISYEDLIVAYPNGQIVERNEVVYYVVDGTDIAILNHIDNPTSGQLLGQAYTKLLQQKADEELAQAKITTAFEGEVEPNYSYKYGEDYFLGDIVTVENDYGIRLNARITEVIESDDDNGHTIIPTFAYLNEESAGDFLLTEEGEPIYTEDGEGIEVEY